MVTGSHSQIKVNEGSIWQNFKITDHSKAGFLLWFSMSLVLLTVSVSSPNRVLVSPCMWVDDISPVKASCSLG